ncbi:MAG: hypothetical protein QGG48_10345 [Desulfatiglandales bacterium]|nr:hypothetical protein [Desulfatiglandales bacterium]
MKLLIISIGRDIVTGAERQLGQSADAVIKEGEVQPKDFPRIRRQVYEKLNSWQGEPIRVVLSGPLTLSFTIGQIVGLNHFDLKVLHYDALANNYTEADVPKLDEMN